MKKKLVLFIIFVSVFLLICCVDGVPEYENPHDPMSSNFDHTLVVPTPPRSFQTFTNFGTNLVPSLTLGLKWETPTNKDITYSNYINRTYVYRIILSNRYGVKTNQTPSMPIQFSNANWIIVKNILPTLTYSISLSAKNEYGYGKVTHISSAVSPTKLWLNYDNSITSHWQSNGYHRPIHTNKGLSSGGVILKLNGTNRLVFGDY